MKEIIEKLNAASYAYYQNDNPIMSDKEYDDLYDELVKMEQNTGIIFANSPTQKVQGFLLDSLHKVKHSKPMLSADKTKDPDEIKQFVGTQSFYCSYKLDGLTGVLRYSDGEFVQGITRGTGEVGEDITEACRFIKNLPLKIPYKGELELRGEIVMSWNDFNEINKTLDNPFSHPRNAAAGTIRNLNLSYVKERPLNIIIFECVSDMVIDNKLATFEWLESIGFDTVNIYVGDVDRCIEMMKPDTYQYPVDGLVFEFQSRKYSESLGKTGKFERCRKALKWADNTYQTILTGVEWNTTRTGIIAPVAVFEPVDLDGAVTTRATLHNLNIIEELEIGIGDRIEVYRANMVIPKVHDNLTRSNTLKIPSKCPCCGAPTKIKADKDSKILCCTNENCPARNVAKFSNFVSRYGMNIDGLSEATLEKLLEHGWIKNFHDIYHLSDYAKQMKCMEGFGEKSVKKLLDSIEKSRKCKFENLLVAIGIPGIGKNQASAIAKYCKTFDNFVDKHMHLDRIDGIGDIMVRNVIKWMDEAYNKEKIENLIAELQIESAEESGSNSLSGKIFVITGSLHHYNNRDELVKVINDNGGKVSGSVSAKTTYLINNDTTSNSSKNKKAKDLGIPIISEKEFVKLLT